MLIEGLLCIVSLSPVRGPGPRATRLGAIADTLGRRARIAVLIARDHEDAALSLQTLAARNATGSIQAWELPIEDHTPRFNQFRAHVYALRRALEERHSWFFWMNDHTFVIAENLACYINGLSRSEPVYAGLRLWGPCCGLFNSAAAGYAVNRAAVKLLVKQWNGGESDEKCDPQSKKAQIALCLKKLGDVLPIDTREASGAERFHVYGPVRLATGAIDDWLVNKKKNIDPPEPFAADASAVSSDVVSFHYVAEKEHRLLDRLLRGDAAVDEMTLAPIWPRGREELGGYSLPWPGRNARAAEEVLTLLRRLRVCEAPRSVTR